MQLFFDPDISGCGHAPSNSLHTLSADESRHAVRVLRLGVGDGLHVTDGGGGMFVCEVVDPSPAACVVRVVEVFADWGRRPYRLTVGVAPTKNAERFEWFLEKATEVGVDVIVPLVCAASERRVVFKPERAERIITSAAKQSLKARFPVIEPLVPVGEFLERYCVSDGCCGGPGSGGVTSGVKLIAHCHDDLSRVPIMDTLKNKPTEVVVLIGPEGDFTVGEVELAESRGFVSVSLGESRLRTETAALAAVMATYFSN